MYKILFTGLGSIGERHLRLLQNHDDPMELHAYRSGGIDEAAFPDVVQHASLTDALAMDPDIAFITNPTSLHVETATVCAESGCHLFIEKPLSHTLDGVDELITTVSDNGLLTYVACVLRFHPVLQRISTLLANDIIGEVYSFRVYSGSYLPDWRPEQDYRSSYSADPEMGGGVILDLIHEIDYSYWLFGDITIVNSWVGQVSNLDIESEDLAETIVETETGVIGQIHLDYYRSEPRRTIEISGESGVIHGNLVDNTVTILTNGNRDTEQYDIDRDELYKRQLDLFLSHIQSGTPCENDLREARKVLEIALEIKTDDDRY
ncbi:Gfo/Idh/MocA family protein [Halorubrum sp. SY-15]|uniref:Gfo/Idh/MocA family protein n=1 Tax=Halorubrum sp. SY-15 TaxID=3402277 RepID=UPI003EB6FE40